jgi:hypothetical protein
MAAGLGFKTFAVGEVLSAANVNGYLMQGVLVFANATARDAAITSPQEGQFAFTKDNDSLWYYSGSAWVASGATGDIEGVTAGVGISGGGTSGTVTVTNSMATAIDAKGDLIAGTGADTFARLAVGTNGHTLVADSAEATGLKWAAPAASGFVGAAIYRDAAVAISNATWTTITWDTEDYDTDAFWASSPNATRITIPSGKGGKYLFNFSACFASNASGVRLCKLQKNGTDILFGNWMGASGDALTINGSGVLNLSASDYIEMQVYQSSGGNLNINTKIGNFIMATYLGA